MPVRSACRALVWLAALLSTTVAGATAPTLEELANATVSDVFDAPLTLEDGRWQGKPYAPDAASRPTAELDPSFRLSGDLNGDGLDEAVALLRSSGGGTGSFTHLVVFGRESGRPVQLAGVGLGDRIMLRAGHIDRARIVVDTIESGPEDPACCPGQSLRRSFELAGAELRESPREDRGRATLALLAGVEWLLDALAPEAPLPEGVEITLRLEGEHLVGSSGCNRYSASIEDGDSAGSVRVGPALGTRRACAGAAGEIEPRYLDALAQVESFAFDGGRLLLRSRREDRGGALSFSPRPVPSER